jgi:hypothetical protein
MQITFCIETKIKFFGNYYYLIAFFGIVAEIVVDASPVVIDHQAGG